VLLHTFEARLDARDPATGSGAVHLLLRETLSSGDRGRAARSPGGAVSVEGVERFRLEPELEMLLRASKAQGFCGDAADVEADPEAAASSKGSLLDVKDDQGRTPLVSSSASWSVQDRTRHFGLGASLCSHSLTLRPVVRRVCCRSGP